MHAGPDRTGADKETAHISQLWSWRGWYHTALGLCSRHSEVGGNLFGATAYQQTLAPQFAAAEVL